MNAGLDVLKGRGLARRYALMAAAALACPLPLPARVLPPVLTDAGDFIEPEGSALAAQFLQVRHPPGYRRIEPVVTLVSPKGGDAKSVDAMRAHTLYYASTRHAREQSGWHALPAPPTAYGVTGGREGVPPWLLFGVALQESQLLFGRWALPYPWTLNVGGRAERHASYRSARDALTLYLGAGVTNVDCGPMQVNWRAHSGLLVCAADALDPYRNLAVGARILRSGYQASGSWARAVGLYHTGSFQGGARRSRALEYVAGVSRRLSRYGLTLADAAAYQEPRHG